MLLDALGSLNSGQSSGQELAEKTPASAAAGTEGVIFIEAMRVNATSRQFGQAQMLTGRHECHDAGPMSNGSRHEERVNWRCQAAGRFAADSGRPNTLSKTQVKTRA